MDKQTRELTESVNEIIKALLVAGRLGAPAEGKLPFNPLYYNMLRSVGSHGRVRPSQLADELAVSRTTISTALKSLQKRDLLLTVKDEIDGRAVNIQLSKEGQNVLNAVIRQDQKNSAAMLEILFEHERDQFSEFLHRIARGLSQAQEE